MNIGVSPLTGSIFIGKSKILPNNTGFQWLTKEDVTDAAIKAVFEHMYIKAEKTGYYSIEIEGFGVMRFERKGGSDE